MNMKAVFFFVLIFFGFSQIAFAVEVEVNEYYSKVYFAPSTNSKCIGLGQKGEIFEELGETAEWYRIQYKNTTGWLSKKDAKRYDPNALPVQPPTSPSDAGNETQQAPASVSNFDSKSDTSRQLNDSTFQPAPQRAKSYSDTVQNSSFVKKLRESVSFTKKSEVDEERVERDRKWFNQQSFHKIIPPSELPQENEPLKYLKINATVAVFPYLDPKAPILGYVQSGKRLLVISEGESWCRVAFKDTVAWVQKKYGRIESITDIGVEIDWVKVAIFGSIILIIIAFMIIRSVMFRRATESNEVKKDLTKKNVLIISKNNKEIESTLTDSTITMDRCFSELGFHVNRAPDLTTLRKILEDTIPDILFIDWHFEKNIIYRVEQLFANVSDVNKIAVFVFNHPDPSYTHQSTTFQTVTFLGIAFSDRDIFKLVTPIIISADSGKEIQKSVQSSALEGEISQGNLLEVLQYIEMGRKTGCMLVECDRPFAIIYFYQGRIIYAHAQELTGKDAVFEVLNLKDGKFRFIQNKVPKTSNVNLSTLEVLMEWTKALDEASGH
jgi:hypothetical protein